MNGLFQLIDFTSHSGKDLHWKIECDALTDAEIEALARMLAERLPPFGVVVGVPRGGLRIGKAMGQYRDRASLTRLIVDDVLTTGASMDDEWQTWQHFDGSDTEIIGAVLFARGHCPAWITALFQMPPERTAWVRHDPDPEAEGSGVTEVDPLSITAYMDSIRWEVSVNQAGGKFTVAPVKGLMGLENWGISLDGKERFWLEVPSSLVNTLSGRAYRREYPSERRLEKSIRECQLLCDRMNAAEAHAKSVLERRASA